MMVNILYVESFLSLGFLLEAERVDMEKWNWSFTWDHRWPQRHGLACCLLEGRLQNLAGTPPNYQARCVVVNYCPMYQAAAGAQPTLSKWNLTNLVTYGRKTVQLLSFLPSQMTSARPLVSCCKALWHPLSLMKLAPWRIQTIMNESMET